MALLAETTGVFGETAAGVTLGALREAVAAGEVGADDRVVLLVTGDGLKTPGPVADRLKPVRIAADADALLDRLRRAGLNASRRTLYFPKADFTLLKPVSLRAAPPPRAAASASAPATAPPAPPPDWELVYKRNPVERLKRDKSPLGILDELPALIAAGYEQVAEEDIVRLKWWGLYHDKPKVGTFMLRIKLAGGHVSPAQAAGDRRDLEPLRPRRRRALHAPEHPAALPRARRAAGRVRPAATRAGLTTAGGCGDTVRNITGCPVAGPRRTTSCSTPTPVVDEAAAFFYGNPDYSNLPRKHKITIAACADRCNAPEINCIALVGAIHDGARGLRRARRRRALVGAAHRARPRRLRPARTRRSRCCARSSTRGRRTCATASRGSRRG